MKQAEFEDQLMQATSEPTAKSQPQTPTFEH